MTRRLLPHLALLLAVFAGVSRATDLPGALPQLKISDNHRFLVTADGRPFFWLGDTAWELFHRLDRAQAEHYLKHRAAQGFTVIQAYGFNAAGLPAAPFAVWIDQDAQRRPGILASPSIPR